MNKQIISILRTPTCHYFLVAFLDDRGKIEEKLFVDSDELAKFLTDYFYLPDWEK